MRSITSVTVFCGSRNGTSPEFVAAAHTIGRRIAERGLDLVYGGAAVGTMGVLADAALEAGGRVVGVIPQGLDEREIVHRGLSEVVQVPDMLERKKVMSARADAYVALPGGIGTLDELFEVLTARQLGWEDKPCGLLNLGGYYDPLLDFLRRMQHSGFCGPASELFFVASSPEELLDRLVAAPLA